MPASDRLPSRIRGVRLAPDLGAVSAYRVPRHPAPVDLALDGNEGACAPPEILRAGEAVSEQARRYPSVAALETRIAQRLGVEPGRVVVTAGGDDALCRALRIVARAGAHVVLPSPTFEMIGTYARLHGLAVRDVPWPGRTWPRESALAAMDADTAAIVMVTPNNPTGATATVDDLDAACRAAEEAGDALVLLDQAYAEYDDDATTRAALERPNVLIVRTLSKAWGLAGLRVGYAVGPADLVARLRDVGQPYAVSGPSIATAIAALESEGGWMREHVARVRRERADLAALLSRLGARPRPSSANFVLAEFDDPAWVADALAGLGIGVRRFPGTPGLERSLRITCPGAEDGFARLSAALSAALAPEAVLFDVDGVLADTSGSYREAIVRTAASFGVEVTADDVRRAKARGDANNDWILTRRLVEAAGRDVDADEVVRRFEALYHGEDGRPGLEATERLLVSRATLDRLRARLPLAIVTGRPRRDVDAFLRRFDILDCFDAVVAMEDGPAKPDPAPVVAALRRLGVSRAWMIGDTPDDVRAARTAGVVPLAVLAPGDDPAATSDVLLRAGAARVLDEVNEVNGQLAPTGGRENRR